MGDGQTHPEDLIEEYREAMLVGKATKAKGIAEGLRDGDCIVCELMGNELGGLAQAAAHSLDDDAVEELTDLGVARAEELLDEMGVENGY